MTLIEVLAVVCLIALAAALTLSGLGAASAAAQLRTALAECRQLDARTRLLAQAEGLMTIAMTDDRGKLYVGQSGMVEAPPLLHASVPVNWSVHLLDAEGKELASLHVDTRGRSNDYLIELRPQEAFDGAPVARRLKVAGLTGWIEEIAGP